MKRYAILLLLAALAALIGCDADKTPVAPPSTTELPGVEQTGELHNQFLALAFSELEQASLELTAEERSFEAAFQAQKEMLESYGLTAFSREQVAAIIASAQETGQAMLAVDDPLDVATMVFSPQEKSQSAMESEFYQDYIQNRQKSRSADEAYAATVAKLGEPEPGSELDVFMDVMLHSDQFWSERYPERAPNLVASKSWRKFIKFVALTAVDAGSGALAGAGYGSVGGPGGSVAGGVVGAVVGGLSSWGANDIIYN